MIHRGWEKLKKIFEMVIILLLLLVGCNNSLQPTRNSLATPTFDSLPKVNTPFVKTATIMPTSIPFPTLSAEASKQKLQSLLDKNGNCKLPCWWEIMPGETKLSDAINILATYVPKIETRNVNYMDAIGSHNGVAAVIYYKPKNEDFDAESSGFFEMFAEDDIVITVSIYKDLTSNFSLATILNDYGKPQDVYVNSLPASPTGEVPFSVILYYPEQGILAEYYNLYGGASIVNDKVNICPQALFPILKLWSPLNALVSEVERNSFLESEKQNFYGQFRNLTDVTNMNIEVFYKTFRQANTHDCIVTSSDIWW